jgi:UDP-N-acetylglucosamine/UDP-N-acetylgalactosamine diphosphorylase
MKHRRKEEWLKSGIIIADDVNTSRIADDVIIHTGCRIRGTETSIGPGSVIGEEAPVTLENCQLGRNVDLKGGFFAGATFFDGANMGSGAHVRSGTILEEDANGAHTVGLKQTILMPFVTLGSLINFCDVLMAGGTSRKDHGEVGSSYIHFNYTPHQDKATASLLGDVPQGVFLNKKPIFLGGQGGLVGPARIAYGSVVAAGGICRQDIPEENQLHIPASPATDTRPYETGVYRDIDRIVKNNLYYFGNMVALKEWYQNVRSVFMCRDKFDQACCKGGLHNLDLVLAERIKRLGGLAHNMKKSFQWLEKQADASEDIIASQRLFHNSWGTLEFELKQSDWAGNTEARKTFLSAIESIPVGGSYTEAIQSLEPKTQLVGQTWLKSIVDEVANLWPPQNDERRKQ